MRHLIQVDGAAHSTQLCSNVFGMSYLNATLAAIWAQVCGVNCRGLKDDATGHVTFPVDDATLAAHVARVVEGAICDGANGMDESKILQLRVPPHLQEFLKREVKTLVRSAVCALRHYTEKVQYRIEADRIIPVNIDTGEVQLRMHYNDGLHEFLQMKHGLPLGEMSLVDNKLSNKAMFRR